MEIYTDSSLKQNVLHNNSDNDKAKINTNNNNNNNFSTLNSFDIIFLKVYDSK